MKGLIPKKKVSVPLRGLWFLSIGIARRTLAGYEAFPSPYGDCGSYQYCPYGINVSYDSVSVPLRGLWFLSAFLIFFFDSPLRGFRPLTGIVVLIRTPYKWLHSAIENAFCGADFLFSSFFTFLWKMIFKNCPIADF